MTCPLDALACKAESLPTRADTGPSMLSHSLQRLIRQRTEDVRHAGEVN